MKLNVLPHGAYRPLDMPEYEAEFAKRAHNAQTGEFTLDKPIQNSSNPLRTIFLKLPKHEKVSDKPTSVGELSRAYPNALVFERPKAMMGMLVAVLPLLLVAITIGGIVYPSSILENLQGEFSIFNVLFNLVLLIIMVSFLLSSIMFCLGALRGAFYNYLDNPVIFDRKHRKVYRVFRPFPLPLEYVKHVFKHWKPFYAWPEVTAVEQDWDCMQAEYTRQFQVLGSQTPSMQHGLQLLVRETTDPNSKVIDGFSLVGPMNEETVMGHWEYIRQFMEEKGPALPEGEKLADNSPLRSPLDALIRMTKGIGVFMWMCHVIALAWVIFGAPLAWNEAYLLLPQNWGDRTLNYLLYHGFFLALPGFFYSWAFFSWLIQLTSIKVEWPSEIQQRLGAPTMGGGH